MAASAATRSDVDIEHDDTLAWHDPAPGVHYGFCRTCGSSLFWYTDERPEHWAICAGTLEPPTGLATTHAIWLRHTSDYHPRLAGVIELDTE